MLFFGFDALHDARFNFVQRCRSRRRLLTAAALAAEALQRHLQRDAVEIKVRESLDRGPLVMDRPAGALKEARKGITRHGAALVCQGPPCLSRRVGWPKKAGAPSAPQLV